MSELFSWAVVGPYTSARNIYWMKMCLKMPDQSEQTNRFSSARGKQARTEYKTVQKSRRFEQVQIRCDGCRTSQTERTKHARDGKGRKTSFLGMENAPNED